MARISPFRGLRPHPNFVSKITVPPYDVVTSDEARRMAEGNPYSFFHVTKPEINFPPGATIAESEMFKRGKECLEAMIREHIMTLDDRPRYYCYTQLMDGREQTGIVACVSIDDYLQKKVKKHELTRKDKEDERTLHIDIVNAHTGQVFLFYKDSGEKQSLFRDALASVPVYDFTTEDGVRQILRVITDDALIESFTKSFADDSLYIADGHHRAAAAVRVGLMRRERHPGWDGTEEFNMFMGVIFPHSQLMILPYNRVIKDLKDMDTKAFIERINEKFAVEKTERRIPPSPHSFCLYCGGSWYMLKPRFPIPEDPVQSLDVSILQEHLFGPILGIHDPRTDKRIDFIGGKNSVDEIRQKVDRGECAAAFSLYPTSIDQLMNVADADGIMPPKSTWFEPKLRSGLVVHLL